MKRKSELPLLLAPAGGEAAFLAAVAAGADAVYLGGSDFNARAYAENFDEETLTRCVRLAHAHGISVHVTMNTLLTERELSDAVKWAGRLWEIGVDAVICADVGLITCLREQLPLLPLHASTQLSLHSSAGAEEVADLGFQVVVAARELKREDLAAMCRRAPAMVEGFIHGALCVSHSGQCLFSSLVGGRSGNRGACAQPCRLPFQGGYTLSLKDLSLAAHVPSLIEDGISCLKIEGRMKSPAYVWGVTKIYRRLLDERRAATEEEKRQLARIFSRDGHTDGYYTGTLAGMTGIRRETDKAESRREEADIPLPSPVRLRASCSIRAQEPCCLTFTTEDGRKATVTGEIPSEARSAPLTAAAVAERLAKLGGTPYRLSTEDISVTLDEGLNLSPAALNALRRAAVERLTDTGREPVMVQEVLPATVRFRGPGRTALFMRGKAWEELDEQNRAFFDLSFIPLWEYDKIKDPPAGVWFPPVITDEEEPGVFEQLAAAKARGASWALCGNPAQVRYARDAGYRVLGDFRLNITNSHAAAYWAGHGVADAVLSPELTAPQMRDIGGRAIVYGRIPLMLTERCYASPDGACASCGNACEGAVLTDRRGIDFPLLRLPAHRNLILNSLPTYLGDKQEDLPRGVRGHFLFTTETAEEIRHVITAWQRGEALPYAVRRFAKPQPKNNREVPEKQGTTPMYKSRTKRESTTADQGVARGHDPARRRGKRSHTKGEKP